MADMDLEQLIYQLRELEQECRKCYGEGVIRSSSGLMPCEECDRTGYTLTESGNTLLDFLKRWRHRLG